MLILGLVLLVAWPFGWMAVVGVAVGGSIQIVNLWGLERSVWALLGLAREGLGFAGQLMLGLRFVMLLTAVAVILVRTPLEPVALLAGLSVSVPAVLWHGWMVARNLRHAEA